MRVLLVIPLLLLPALSTAQAPSPTDVAMNQLQDALQQASALRKAQLAVHTSIAAAANPISSAQAQTPSDAPFVLPPVPTAGVSPLVQWLLGVASAVLIACMPLLTAFVKQHFALDAVVKRSAMINTAVTHSAHTYLDDKAQGMGDFRAAKNALAYVKQSHPDAIRKTPQATDLHLADAIRTEASRIAREVKPPPVVNVQSRLPLVQPTAPANAPVPMPPGWTAGAGPRPTPPPSGGHA